MRIKGISTEIKSQVVLEDKYGASFFLVNFIEKQLYEYTVPFYAIEVYPIIERKGLYNLVNEPIASMIIFDSKLIELCLKYGLYGTLINDSNNMVDKENDNFKLIRYYTADSNDTWVEFIMDTNGSKSIIHIEKDINNGSIKYIVQHRGFNEDIEYDIYLVGDSAQIRVTTYRYNFGEYRPSNYTFYANSITKFKTANNRIEIPHDEKQRTDIRKIKLFVSKSNNICVFTEKTESGYDIKLGFTVGIDNITGDIFDLSYGKYKDLLPVIDNSSVEPTIEEISSFTAGNILYKNIAVKFEDIQYCVIQTTKTTAKSKFLRSIRIISGKGSKTFDIELVSHTPSMSDYKEYNVRYVEDLDALSKLGRFECNLRNGSVSKSPFGDEQVCIECHVLD